MGVRDNYQKLVDRFTSCLDREIDDHLETIFMNANDRTNFRTLEKHYVMYSDVRDAARLKVTDRRALWNHCVEESSNSLGVNIQSKK
jgi:hypothetical protein